MAKDKIYERFIEDFGWQRKKRRGFRLYKFDAAYKRHTIGYVKKRKQAERIVRGLVKTEFL